MEQRKQDVVEIEIKELIIVLLHKWWLILLVCILTIVLSGIYTINFVTPMYTSTSKVYVINREYDYVTTWSDLQSGTYLARDLMILVKSRSVIEEVITRLKLDMSIKELTNLISVYTPEDTRFMEIMVSHPDPLIAKQLVDAVVEVSSERMISVIHIEKVNVVEEGNIPLYPSSPNLVKISILGGFIGSVLTAMVLVVRNILNDTIKTSEDIEKYLGITTLGVIPLEELDIKKNKRHRASKHKANEALAS